MSAERAKRSTDGVLTVKQRKNDELRPSPALTAESTTSLPKKIIMKSADMKDDLQKEAVNIAISAFEKNNVEKDVAEYIKKEFDMRHGPTWHCIVGRNFGSYVTHETNHFVYFYLDQKQFCSSNLVRSTFLSRQRSGDYDMAIRGACS